MNLITVQKSKISGGLKSWTRFVGLEPDQVLNEFGSRKTGLSADEVNLRRRTYGANVARDRSQSWSGILIRQFKSPFTYLLVAASAISAFLTSYDDAVAIMVFIILNAVLGFFQEFKSERTIRLLGKYLKMHSRVMRDGKSTLVSVEELVPGDILLFHPGDVVPCDCRLIDAYGLTVDESVLTGESAQVEKNAPAVTDSAASVSDAVMVVFAGTTITRGRGTGIIIALSGQSELGRLADHAARLEERGVFEKDLMDFSSFILKLVLVTLVLLFGTNIAVKGIGNVNIIELLIFSLALAVGVIPEALPVVTTFSFTRGAMQLAKNKVVVKKLSAIEDLGSIEVLCTDKTGTLTENRLSVKDISGDTGDILVYMVAGAEFLAHGADPTDPFDAAVWSHLNDAERLKVRSVTNVSYVPFDPLTRRFEAIIRIGHDEYEIYRGAWETIMALPTSDAPGHIRALNRWGSKQNEDGHRLLGVAVRKCVRGKPCQKKFHLAGGVAFSDTVKQSASEAVMLAGHLGVRLVILTGDSREVARQVARTLGIIGRSEDAITGSEFASLSSADKLQAVRSNSVFARVDPFQKNEITDLLQLDKTVGFLGDGINDAIGLKSADVGIVVSTASEVAKSAADIILLEKDLKVIIEGIREGRKISVNIKKYLTATLASNFGNFYAIAITTLLVRYLPMLPIQVLLLNLLSDFPMISISFDSVQSDSVRRPQQFHVRSIIMLATFLGIISTVFDFIFFAVYRNSGPSILQTNWFIGSVLTELALIYVIRTRKAFFRGRAPAAVLVILTFGAAILTLALPFIPFGRQMFGFSQPGVHMIYLDLVLVAAYFMTTEIVKRLYYAGPKKHLV